MKEIPRWAERLLEKMGLKALMVAVTTGNATWLGANETGVYGRASFAVRIAGAPEGWEVKRLGVAPWLPPSIAPLDRVHPKDRLSDDTGPRVGFILPEGAPSLLCDGVSVITDSIAWFDESFVLAIESVFPRAKTMLDQKLILHFVEDGEVVAILPGVRE